MLLKILLLLTLCVSNVTAYAVAGAYERMWFWQAYQLDVARNGGKATKIAKMCSKENNTKRPCNFQQFLKYIAATTEERTAIDSPAFKKDLGKVDTKTMSPDEGAKILVKHDITGTYRIRSMFEQLKERDTPALFQAMAAFIGKEASPQRDNSLVARDRIQELRDASQDVTVGNKWREHHAKADPKPKNWDKQQPRIPWTKGDVPETERILPNGIKFLDCNLVNAWKKIREREPNFPEFGVAVASGDKSGGNHRKNIAALEEASMKMGGCS